MDILSISPELAPDIIKLLSSKLSDSKTTLEASNAEKSRLLEQNKEFQERNDALNSKIEEFYDKVKELSEQNQVLRSKLAELHNNNSGHRRHARAEDSDCSNATCAAAITVETLRAELESLRRRLSASEAARVDMESTYTSRLALERAKKAEYRSAIEDYRIELEKERADKANVQRAPQRLQPSHPAIDPTSRHVEEAQAQHDTSSPQVIPEDPSRQSVDNPLHLIPCEISPWRLPQSILHLLSRGAAGILVTSSNLIIFQEQGYATIMAPECRFNPHNVFAATSPPRHKLEKYANQKCDVFMRSHRGTAYIGTYQVSDVSRYSVEEYRALPQPTKRALQASSFTTSKDKVPDPNMQRIQNKYHIGQATVQYVSLRLAGFNAKFYSALGNYIHTLSPCASGSNSDSRGDKRKASEDVSDAEGSATKRLRV